MRLIKKNYYKKHKKAKSEKKLTNVLAILLLKKIFPCLIAAKQVWQNNTHSTDTHHSGEMAKL